MAKFSQKLTKRYLRDLKLACKRGMDESLLNEIIVKLLDDVPLPEKNRNHQLHGDYGSYRECLKIKEPMRLRHKPQTWSYLICGKWPTFAPASKKVGRLMN